jgi:hypothetical protein
MRTLLTLMKREIIDQAAYFVGAVALSGIITFVLVSMVLGLEGTDLTTVAIGGSIPVTLVVVIGLCGLGVAQMYNDQTRKISALLIVLPTTRWQIFVARVAAGLLAILILLIPLAIAGTVLVDLRTADVPLYAGVLGDVLRSVFLVCFACYSIGLYAGWGRRSLTPTLGLLPVIILIPLLMIIKGFGPEVAGILLVFIAACLAATWCRFSSSSL